MKATTTQYNLYPFLKGGGESAQLILDYDWSQSPIGNPDTWPLSLRTTLGNILHTAFPMFLFWGKDLICFYNDAFRPSLGIDGKHPAIGEKGINVWGEIWSFIGPLIEQVITTGKPAWFEDQIVSYYRNGQMEDVYWTFSYSPAYGDNNEIAGVLVTCMETTRSVIARRQVEDTVAQRTAELAAAHQSLLEANQYLQNIINLFKEPLQVLEPVIEDGEIVDFRYKLTNASYAAYASTTPEHIYNRNVSDIFPGYLQTSSFTKNAEIFKTGIADTWDLHYNQDGLSLHNRMSAAKMGGELVVHFTDFTSLKNLQIELENKIEELERSNQRLEEFAHAASHDLKEPIRKILVFTTLLKEQLSRKLTEHEVKTFERIESASRRMSLLIEDLLMYTHVSQTPLQKEAVDLNETIQQVFEDLDLDIQQTKAVIQVDELPVVNGYKRQLQQLFQNLVSNALKYSNPARPVIIRISTSAADVKDQPYHLITVQDNGIGFEQQYAEKIFQMFTRLHGKSEYSGTGVGLSIVKKIIENHQGNITAVSAPGEGTTFSVWLPMR